MANIFSGMFTGGSGGDNSALSRIRYQQEMDEYELARATKQRQSDLSELDPGFELSIQSMSPERQNSLRRFRKMSG